MHRPKNPDALTGAERQRRARANRAGIVTLTPHGRAILLVLQRDGETLAATIDRIIIAASPRPARTSGSHPSRG